MECGGELGLATNDTEAGRDVPAAGRIARGTFPAWYRVHVLRIHPLIPAIASFFIGRILREDTEYSDRTAEGRKGDICLCRRLLWVIGLFALPSVMHLLLSNLYVRQICTVDWACPYMYPSELVQTKNAR